MYFFLILSPYIIIFNSMPPIQEVYKTVKVFTPTQPAISSFVERSPKVNNTLVDALMTPGKQIVLYGHSGCGKITLLTNKINETYEKHYITRCMESMSFENIIMDGFSQLDNVINEKSQKNIFSISPEISIDYNDIKGSFKLFTLGNEKTNSSRSIIPVQLTPQKLAKFFGEAKACWILEDFHKIKKEEKSKTSQLMKVFMDMSLEYPEVKLIAIGALGTARQVVEYDKEMNNRVTEVFVPYMRDNEIIDIIENGEKLLNLIFSKEVKDKIVKFSCGLPSICHQLCLNICFDKRIYKTLKNTQAINIDDLDIAIEKFLEEKSDSFKADFDKAIKISKGKKNIPQSILEACLTIDTDEFNFDKILAAIRDKTITSAEVIKYLRELSLPIRAEILIFDENSNNYRFNNLFLKAYCFLRLKDSIKHRTVSRDIKIIKQLLDIIEKDNFRDINTRITFNVSEIEKL
ncbi:hypothetical protein BAY07_16015 [Elizabethkingia bruuniana]|nr:hypothetical protein BAY07_16015 [Elizabethkingia bruuniana]